MRGGSQVPLKTPAVIVVSRSTQVVASGTEPAPTARESSFSEQSGMRKNTVRTRPGSEPAVGLGPAAEANDSGARSKRLIHRAYHRMRETRGRGPTGQRMQRGRNGFARAGAAAL